MVATALKTFIHPWVRQNVLRKVTLFLGLAVVVMCLVLWRTQVNPLPPKADTAAGSSNQTAPATSTSQTQNFNKTRYSVNEPSSLWTVVNKGRILPSDYVPKLALPNVPNRYGNSANDSHLQSETATALEQLFAAARQAGYSLVLYSGYRSYDEQVSTYNGFVSRDGIAKADTYSARPGHSEHQTGLAADISAINGKCDLDQCFGDTPGGKWLAANAYRFGFIMRYQLATQDITGYEYEPWHFRYVGTDLAGELYKNNQTMEQFFNLPTYKFDAPYPDNPYQLKAGL